MDSSESFNYWGKSSDYGRENTGMEKIVKKTYCTYRLYSLELKPLALVWNTDTGDLGKSKSL